MNERPTISGQSATPVSGNLLPPLLTPITIRGVTLRNRIVMSPMCQYSCHEGMATDWHVVHLGSRASGGAALVMTEATAVTRDGRISADDLGIWSDNHTAPLARVASYIRSQGAVAGIQLAHAGRKASRRVPYSAGSGPLTTAEGAWPMSAPSALAFDSASDTPAAMTLAQIDGVFADFVAGARRAMEAGFEVIEIHAAHGYLINQFLSPLSNQRTDEYGGSRDNRMRFLMRIATAIRAIMPHRLPLFVRISATDWVEGGWTIEDSVVLAGKLKDAGVDVIDCSTGGNSPLQKIKAGPGYQVPFATRIRAEAKIATGAVGLITDPKHANEIVANGDADLVILARAMLRDAYWAVHAYETLGVRLAAEQPWPKQYAYAFRPRD